MKLIDRYLSKEITVTACFAVAVLSLVIVLVNILKQLLNLLVNQDVPLEIILSFVGYILPSSLTYSIPWGMLTAVLLVFGKLSAENELIALRTAGLSIYRICAPLLVLSVLCVMLCLWINVDVAPPAKAKMKNAISNIAMTNPMSLFGSDEVIDAFDGKKIYIASKHGNELEQVLMYDINKQGVPMQVVYADKGKLEIDLPNKRVLLRLFEARFEQRDDEAPWDLTKVRQGITAEVIPLVISLQKLYEKSQRRPGLGQMTMQELLSKDDKDDKDDPKQRSAVLTEANKRVAFSLASVVLVLIGVPLAITAQRRETSIGFLFSLVIAFVYFFFNIVVDATRNRPEWRPELLIWAPNVLFIALGIFMFVRLGRK